MLELRQFEENIHNNVTVKHAIEKLSDKERVVLVLRASGYTQLECSRIIGSTRAAVGFIQKRGLRKIRAHIQAEIDDVVIRSDYDVHP